MQAVCRQHQAAVQQQTQRNKKCFHAQSGDLVGQEKTTPCAGPLPVETCWPGRRAAADTTAASPQTQPLSEIFVKASKTCDTCCEYSVPSDHSNTMTGQTKAC